MSATVIEFENPCKVCEGTGKAIPDCDECDGYGWVDDPDDGGTMICPECHSEPCDDCEGTGIENGKSGE